MHYLDQPLEPGIFEARVDEAARLFAGLGHELVPAAPPVGSEEVLSPMLPLIASAAANAID
ncbi:amidase, partial [Burkholderia sp. SIMBA_013]